MIVNCFLPVHITSVPHYIQLVLLFSLHSVSIPKCFHHLWVPSPTRDPALQAGDTGWGSSFRFCYVISSLLRCNVTSCADYGRHAGDELGALAHAMMVCKSRGITLDCYVITSHCFPRFSLDSGWIRNSRRTCLNIYLTLPSPGVNTLCCSMVSVVIVSCGWFV